MKDVRVPGNASGAWKIAEAGRTDVLATGEVLSTFVAHFAKLHAMASVLVEAHANGAGRTLIALAGARHAVTVRDGNVANCTRRAFGVCLTFITDGARATDEKQGGHGCNRDQTSKLWEVGIAHDTFLMRETF